MRPIFSASAALLLAGTMVSGAAWAQTAMTPRQERAGLPAGPYLLSCTHAHMVNGRLVALCDDRTNATGGLDTWHMAQLPNARACSEAIENVNGRLTCGTMPMVGSSTPPQYYGSSFGTLGSSSGYPGEAMGPASEPYTPPYSTQTTTPPSYGSWQQPAYHPTAPTR